MMLWRSTSGFGNFPVASRIAKGAPESNHTLQRCGTTIDMSFVFLAFSTCNFAFIGQAGPQHSADSAEWQCGIAASNGIAPMARTTTLATILLKYFIPTDHDAENRDGGL